MRSLLQFLHVVPDRQDFYTTVLSKWVLTALFVNKEMSQSGLFQDSNKLTFL